jgi:hypothetical protein
MSKQIDYVKNALRLINSDVLSYIDLLAVKSKSNEPYDKRFVKSVTKFSTDRCTTVTISRMNIPSKTRVTVLLTLGRANYKNRNLLLHEKDTVKKTKGVLIRYSDKA